MIGSLLPLLSQVQPESRPIAKPLARVWFENVSARPMKGAIVRGNLPLPPTFPGPVPPLTLAYDRRPLPTQVTVLTTYPPTEAGGGLGRPEIVELAARVDLPPFPSLTLEVLATEGGATEGRPTTGPEVARLFGAKDPLVVRGADVFGNDYEARIPLGEEPTEVFRR
ncbi:MAG TPA: hypothetical protein VKF62_12070, partial [Planctomycetota bacterium]|nr:hypothetical protein [Planctomycetota bacterium]